MNRSPTPSKPVLRSPHLVNDESTKPFLEVAADWLYGKEFIVYVATGVVVLFYLSPAYKRYRTRALLLLVASTALGLFVTVFDATVGNTGPPNPNDWRAYYFCRELVWHAGNILWTIGIVLFLRDYTRLASALPTKPPIEQPDDQTRNA